MARFSTRNYGRATWPASDYNRGLAAPVRWVHMLASWPTSVWRWVGDESRRAWALPLVSLLVVVGILIPTDRWTSRVLSEVYAGLGGDPKRELMALQQFGQFSITLIAMFIVWRLDVRARRAVGAWLLGLGLAWVVYQPMKMLVGRPRPKFDDPLVFLGPLGQYPISNEVGVRHAWEFWAGISSDLWSMPSSHTAAAAVMAVILGRLYPSIRGLVVGLAVLVGVMRVMTRAHYASDVAVGAIVGVVAARVAWKILVARQSDAAGMGEPVVAERCSP